MINLELANNAGLLFRRPIEEAGFTLVTSSNFEKLADLADEMGHDITPHFHPRQNTFFWNEAFWIGVFKDGRCAAYCAAKQQTVGQEGLIEYLKRYWKRVYREGSKTKIEFARNQMKRLNICGSLVYSGAWFVHPDYLKSGIGKNLGKYIICTSYLEWRETDYFYIFMNDRDVRSGLGAALELSDQISNALQWDSLPSQAKDDYWMLGMSRDDFEDWAKIQLRVADQN